MSPEQARGQAVDKRTDVWAFGCVLYEMLTGRMAFGGATLSDTIAAVIEREPDWQALPSSTPAAHPQAPSSLSDQARGTPVARHRRRRVRSRECERRRRIGADCPSSDGSEAVRRRDQL